MVTFKVWKNTLTAHIQQDQHHHHFMPGGLYHVWRAAEYGVRIEQLEDADADKVTLDGKRERLGEPAYAAQLAILLNTRNAQLAKFISHIATLCHHTENDDITNSCTSLDWIFEYLKKHYGLETKGANFLNISEHSFKKGTPYNTFYKQFRASFLDNLRRQGDIVKYKNNFVLPEDEKLSPSFENAIVLWSLDKIDPRLPAKVKKNYGHQMTGDTTLKDIQPVIFENIDHMIDELENAQTTKMFAAQSLEDSTDLNSINFQNRNSSATRAKPRNFTRGGMSRNNFTRLKMQKKSVPTKKYCRICDLAGSPPQVYTSHEIGKCSRLSIKDIESLRDAMVLNGLVVLPQSDIQEPSYECQPGWDDLEAEETHSVDESE